MQKKKIIFVKFVPKRSAPKWTSNKMGNVKMATTKQAASKWSLHKVIYPICRQLGLQKRILKNLFTFYFITMVAPCQDI